MWGPVSRRTALAGGEGRDLWCPAPWSLVSHGTWDFEPERSRERERAAVGGWVGGAPGLRTQAGVWAGLWAGLGAGEGRSGSGASARGRAVGRGLGPGASRGRGEVGVGGVGSRRAVGGVGAGVGAGGVVKAGRPLPRGARRALGFPRRGGCLAGLTQARSTLSCTRARAGSRTLAT